MRNKVSLLFVLFCSCMSAKAQLSVRYNPQLQPRSNMQYFKPQGTNLFVGDCIPFFDKGTYYLYWLIDSAHHSALKGLGGHQWVLSTSTDLRQWTHYPVVIGIDEEWEKSICTGSVVKYKNQYYAFYATRLVKDGKTNEQLSYAISPDGIHFKKQQPNPFYTSAPGYSKRDFRDPKVIVDKDGTFHLFIASKTDSATLKGTEGCLVHLVSADLKKWEVKTPVLTGQPSVPECPDYFFWKGWYYLVYSDNSNTYYVKSKGPYGPWEEPAFQALNEEWSNVVKMAAFKDDRMIAAGWVPSRLDNKDAGREIFGGNTVFRELGQLNDGTLTTGFPAETIPATGPTATIAITGDSLAVISGNSVDIRSGSGIGTAHIEHVPVNCRITMEIEPVGMNESYGLYLRSTAGAASGYQLNLSAADKKVSLFNSQLSAVGDLDKSVKLDIVMKNDIIDVSINNRRCIVNRAIESLGDQLWLYVKHGHAKFKSLRISPLEDK